MVDIREYDLWQCPNCASHWGIEEIDWQECDACGWPDMDEQYEPDDDLPTLHQLDEAGYDLDDF